MRISSRRSSQRWREISCHERHSLSMRNREWSVAGGWSTTSSHSTPQRQPMLPAKSTIAVPSACTAYTRPTADCPSTRWAGRAPDRRRTPEPGRTRSASPSRNNAASASAGSRVTSRCVSPSPDSSWKRTQRPSSVARTTMPTLSLPAPPPSRTKSPTSSGSQGSLPCSSRLMNRKFRASFLPSEPSTLTMMSSKGPQTTPYACRPSSATHATRVPGRESSSASRAGWRCWQGSQTP
mmetsp:Transcript_145832/g.406185  ORF Transcript_145832/g.406185 Transcript_145832/m.406185 type:complete len:237 (+) Transcript_145832:743-1453(+)